MNCNLLELHNCSIEAQLRIEEALLRAGRGMWCLMNRGTPPAIVMGISGKVEELVHREKAQALGLPILKRFSGGGTVVVDENTLFVTFIGDGKRFPEPLMRWSAELFPLIELRENDYVIGERKVGGNAQYLRKERWLHHTSLLWDYSADHMNCLQMPRRTPLYRNERSHLDFIGKLKEHFADEAAFFSQVRERLQERFVLRPVSFQEIEPILAIPHRQSTTVVPFL
ncbi:MAG: lipoate--protein ligase family protein [Verrucomicrobia bacterium]|nr:lipoate--protein ligase family protein [Verrucomicrobiota bacterium]